MIGQFFDSMIVANDQLMTSGNNGTLKSYVLESAGNCFEPP